VHITLEASFQREPKQQVATVRAKSSEVIFPHLFWACGVSHAVLVVTTLTVIDRCITLITKAHRCVLQWASEMLERLAGKLERAVLR
jgi:hypothetical protein